MDVYCPDETNDKAVTRIRLAFYSALHAGQLVCRSGTPYDQNPTQGTGSRGSLPWGDTAHAEQGRSCVSDPGVSATPSRGAGEGKG